MFLKQLPIVFLLAALSIQAGADTVIGEEKDHTPGRGFGTLTGIMVGAIGGPLGAVAGAAAGWYAGEAIQKGSGLSGRAYRVRDESGKEQVVRSPNQAWQAGDQVSVRNGRLYRL
jgi:outer membrane lipoprotein SlyB